jgi:molybdopterin/thiamine biosynthesis adenylyltransferase
VPVTKANPHLVRMALDDFDESAGIILAGVVADPDRLTLCLHKVVWVKEAAYDVRSPTEMWIRSEGWMPALGEAAASNWQPIFFHTHPALPPAPSTFDVKVGESIETVFETRAERPYATLILGGTAQAPRFTGTVAGEPIEQLRIVGDRIRLLAADDAVEEAFDADVFDRQIRAFGEDGQKVLRRLRVGVVGGGGTGSAVFEQLIRLGVGTVLVADDDKVTGTNLTRIHESEATDIGEAKVTTLSTLPERLKIGNAAVPITSKITYQPAFEALRQCDAVFGCTDDNAGRAILSRLAYYYCLPVIDMGVLITARDDKITGLDARMTVMAPGTPCLFCRGRIDLSRLREEMQPPEELEQLVAEGYAQGLAERDPSVIPYTTLIASLAVDELLQRLFGFGSDTRASELLVRFPSRELRRLAGASQQGCFCADPEKLGRGDVDPLLDRMWS